MGRMALDVAAEAGRSFCQVAFSAVADMALWLRDFPHTVTKDNHLQTHSATRDLGYPYPSKGYPSGTLFICLEAHDT